MIHPLDTNQPVLVNGRYRVHRVTGVQRYAHEIVNRLGGRVKLIEPDKGSKGAKGHAWEQSGLALAARQQLLWNPCGSGPLMHSNQVTTFHDLFPIEFPEWYGDAYANWYRFAMMRLAKRAKHLIAVSEYTKERLIALTHRDPADITVISNGCSIPGRADNDAIEAAKHKLGLTGCRYVLGLSSREKRKNIKTTLAAWSIIQQKLPENTWLVLAGPQPDARVYGAQGIDTALPKVLFTGYVPEEHLAGLYSGAALFVFPSLAEGFGLPLLEAMACGVRCITSSNTSLPEVGGDVVDYIDPSRPQELAERMLSRLQANDDGPFLPAMERAAGFNWDTAAQQTGDVLQGVQETERFRIGARRSAPWVVPQSALPQVSLGGRLTGSGSTPLRVTLIHDWLTGMRGGEKVLETLCERFPSAPLFTLLHNTGTVSDIISRRSVKTSWLQKMPKAALKYRNYLPLLPLFAEMNKVSNADLVISTSHCVAKGMVKRGGNAPYHICYIHTPMRYAWDRFDDYFGPERVGAFQSRFLFRPLAAMLRRYDRRTASRVDVFVANSRYVAERVRKFYGRPAHVLPPPVDTERLANIPRSPKDWYLVVSALVPYKKVDHAIRACAELNVPLKIVGRGPELENLKTLVSDLYADVEFIGFVSDDVLPNYYASAKALLFPGIEDFGIVPVEALACGCPVVALAEGGVLDVLNEDIGQLYSDASPLGLATAILALDKRPSPLDAQVLRNHAKRFSTENFVSGMETIISRTLPHLSLESGLITIKPRIINDLKLDNEADGTQSRSFANQG